MIIESGVTISGGVVFTAAAAEPANDPYFSSVTALVATTSTNLANNNTFLDSSTNNFTITRFGNSTQGAYSPFPLTQAYTTATNGGSMYFDGVADYLTTPSTAAFNFGTGNFTIECWFNIYANSSPNPGNQRAAALFSSVSNTTLDGYELGLLGNSTTTGTGIIFSSFINGNQYAVLTVSPISQNVWHHVAAVRSGTTLTIYLDGAVFATSATFNYTTDSNTLVKVGAFQTQTAPQYFHYFNGYISSLRVVKGTAVYTAAFTPPTAPLTAIANTSYLLNSTNAAIYDAAAVNDFETVAQVKTSTAVVKYNSTSVVFDGTVDSVVSPTNTAFGYGTGDFTIEFWVYFTAVNTDQTLVSNLTSASSVNPHIYKSADATIRYYTNGADRITTTAVSENTWYHVALSRASGSTKLFVNGTQNGSTYADSNNYGTSAPFGLGTYWSGGSPVTSGTLQGYIDGLRITKGVARYTANFTPPAAAFPTY